MALHPALAKLPTAADVAADRVGKPLEKPMPHQLTRKAEKRAAVLKDDAFRDLIWALDQHRSRATGKYLYRSGTLDWDQLGEVDHSIPRSLAPDRLWDATNALLLSKAENRLRKVPCPRAPEFRLFDYSGPDNRREPQHFVWRDSDGKIVKERVG